MPRAKSRAEWQDAARQKIQSGMILKKLIDHVVADTDLMSASQVNAARVLLNKVLPDMKEIEHKGDGVAGGLLLLKEGRSKDECIKTYVDPKGDK